jgi:phosphate uptake regulator
MNIFRRKLQLIAGATYTLSLPKSWVLEQGLSTKDELTITQKDDSSLVINAKDVSKNFSSSMFLDVEKYERNIETVIFALYYKGVESISLFSKKDISSSIKKRIRSVLLDMSGTEIVYEDPKKITINVMINKDKIDFFQVLYRMVLLIESSITNLTSVFDTEEIKLNEDEVDRLYNLSTKILSSSLHNSSLLQSSNIKSISIIPSLFIIIKRLENISDNLQIISNKISKKLLIDVKAKQSLQEISSLLSHCAKYWLGKQNDLFLDTQGKKVVDLEILISTISDLELRTLVQETFRFVRNIEEELVMVSFHRQLK